MPDDRKCSDESNITKLGLSQVFAYKLIIIRSKGHRGHKVQKGDGVASVSMHSSSARRLVVIIIMISAFVTVFLCRR